MTEAHPEITAGRRTRSSRYRRPLIMASVPLLLLALGAYSWLSSGRFVSTDDAYVEQNMVTIAPEVAGRVVQVFVRENQTVRRGDPLFRIDPRPYRIALAEADAQLAAAQVQVNELQTQRFGTVPDIEGAEANLAYARRQFGREAALLDQGFATRVSFEEALHAVQEAQRRLNDARAEAASATAQLSGGGPSRQPAVLQAKAARAQALLNLARTEVRAPSSGRVSQTDDLQVGTSAMVGAPLLTIVRGGTTRVDANFKETALANMRVGQRAVVRMDAYPGVRFNGHVASIGTGTGSQFSLLPAQNATGNWVKVTQRVPVRIAMDGDGGRRMIAGLSAKVSVDTASAKPAPPNRR